MSLFIDKWIFHLVVYIINVIKQYLIHGKTSIIFGVCHTHNVYDTILKVSEIPQISMAQSVSINLRHSVAIFLGVCFSVLTGKTITQEQYPLS